MPPLTTCLWFNENAEEAVNFYASIFKSFKAGRSTYYSEVSSAHGKPGTLMTREFEIEGHTFVALNGGPHFKFTPAVSFVIHCKTQEEIDYYWSRLTEGGVEVQCGWLEDKFGVSWQVVPEMLLDLVTGGDKEKADRATAAMLNMVKFNIADLQRAVGS